MNFLNDPLMNNVQARERRATDRFPIERDLKFRLSGRRFGEEMGDGKTVNLSSGGILFRTDHMLIPGKKLELAVSWPAQLDQHCALKLVAKGRVVRSKHGEVAVELQQHEFRTVGASGLAI